MRRFPLARRDLVALLRENGFVLTRTHGSHQRYTGVIDARTRYVEIDQGIDEFAPERHRVLGHILVQLGFLDDDRAIPPSVAWERLYAGERGVARRAQITFRRWDDVYWQEWYA